MSGIAAQLYRPDPIGPRTDRASGSATIGLSYSVSLGLMNFERGTRIGPYEIVGLIGAGGMGEVYRGRDPRLGRDVAVKVLTSEFASDPERLRRFEQEARAAAALS